MGLQKSISKNDLGMYASKAVQLESGEKYLPKECPFSQLKFGLNHRVIICGKVVGIVPNIETVSLFAFILSILFCFLLSFFAYLPMYFG